MIAKFEQGYALLIGVGYTQHPSLALSATINDVRELAKVLKSPEHCAYPESNVVTLLDEAAHKKGILANLEWLEESAGRDPNATILVYYSGHGWRNGRDQYYLIPHDVDPNAIEKTALSARSFSSALNKINPRRLLTVLDTCHAEGMANAKNAKDAVSGVAHALLSQGLSKGALPEQAIERLGEGRGRAVLTSCSGSQSSWIFRDKNLSVFTFHLIEALKGAGSRPADPFVKVSHLMNHVSEEVKRSARAMGHEQVPFFKEEAEDFPVALLNPSPDADIDTLISRIPDLEVTYMSWLLLFHAGRTGALEEPTRLPLDVVAATRHILGALSIANPEPRIENVLRTTVTGLVRQGTAMTSPEGLVQLHMELGHALGSEGCLEAAFRSQCLCRKIIDVKIDEKKANHRILELREDLINREAVTMRDEFQPRLALDHLSEYRLPTNRIPPYREICLLGTKAQVLSHLAEIDSAEASKKHLDEAGALLRYVIDYFEKDAKYAHELPRDYNYLGTVQAAEKDFEAMEKSLEKALDLNDRWFLDLPSQSRETDRQTWIGNSLFTFQLWLRFYDLNNEMEAFDTVDRRYQKYREGVVDATGDRGLLKAFERRYPAVLIQRYRARMWARKLTDAHAGKPEPRDGETMVNLQQSYIWKSQVEAPLLEVLEIFEKEVPIPFLAAAVLVDLLMLANPRADEIMDWARRLEEYLSTLAQNSRRHWKDRGRDSGGNSVYSEPFDKTLRKIRKFLDDKKPSIIQLDPTLATLRQQLGY